MLLILLFILVCAFPTVMCSQNFFVIVKKKVIGMELFFKKIISHLPLESALSTLNPHLRQQSSLLYRITRQILCDFLLSQISGFHPVFSSLIATTQLDYLSEFIQYIPWGRHCTRYNTILITADIYQLIPLAVSSRHFQLEVTQ